MPRALRLLLSAYLLVWAPLQFAVELLTALPSVDARGIGAIGELTIHAGVAMLCALAGRMVWTRAPAARPFASAAVLARGAVAVQSIFASVLPRDIAPGSALPLAALSLGITAFWLIVIARSVEPGK
jgi:hypothetical protein